MADDARTAPRRPARRRALLVVVAAVALFGLFFGCVSTVTPPPEDPVAVFLLHDDRHRLLAVRRAPAGFAVWSYGDWDWYAHNHDAWYYGFDTVLWPFRGWLFTTALHKIVSRDRHHRREKRDVGRLLAAGEADRLLDAYATCTTPSVRANSAEQVAAIESAIEELTEEQREVITLARLVGLSHTEIAEQTGRSEEASRQLLRRGLIRLETVLERRGF